MLSRCLHDCQMSDMKLRRGAAASGKSRRRIEKAFRPKISGGLQAALALRLTRFYYYDRAAAKYVYKKHCFFVHFKSCSDYFSCCFISRPSSVTALLFSWGEVICSWKKYFHDNFSLEYLSKHFKIPNKATFHFHGNWNLWKSIFYGTKLKGGFDEIFSPWTDDFTLSFVTNLLELLLIEMATFFGPRLFYLPSLLGIRWEMCEKWWLSQRSIL